MFGIFKKKTRRAAAEIKKFEKRDLAQAVINAAYLVACADGECEASEKFKAKIEQVLRNQPALSAFTSEINAISATIIGQLDTNFKTGRRAALREIEDVKHDTREAEDVLDVAVAIAEADGEIEPEERKVLEEIAGVLGLRLENHL
ncbi:tellurite resistance TerB family protein [Escherichia coli]|uniref:tellurite resistance TerB family protein n=5 Tax=Escherichia coli TaxID=562 RepID=UPI000DC71279|nr:tellurite resistance TerB family protein [Escherichia coli]BBC50427.1 TciA/TerB-like protein [Escherichia coli O157:H7]